VWMWTDQIGEPVEIVGLQEKSQNSVVTGVEMFHKMMDEGQAGDNLGCYYGVSSARMWSEAW